LSDSPINWFAEKNAMSSLDVALPKMTSCRVGNETREGREGRERREGRQSSGTMKPEVIQTWWRRYARGKHRRKRRRHDRNAALRHTTYLLQGPKLGQSPGVDLLVQRAGNVHVHV